MNKKLLALLAVAAVGVSVAGATPQTQFNKGEFKLILVLQVLKQKWMVAKMLTNGTSMVV
jgi:ompA family protein